MSFFDFLEIADMEDEEQFIQDDNFYARGKETIGTVTWNFFSHIFKNYHKFTDLIFKEKMFQSCDSKVCFTVF